METASHFGGFPCEARTPEELSRMNMDCDHADFGFSTRSAAPLIREESHTTFVRLSGSDHTSNEVVKTNKAFFVFDDVDYAKRFAKAFAHAVQLCGGKPAPF
jgi:hypothetical protein